MDAAWMSTMIHHIADLDAAARELRRGDRPGRRPPRPAGAALSQAGRVGSRCRR
ncbi:hypothetical protein ACIBTZ_32060 [Micromonospora sp. NPDC049460]|uniref:hypothetical protein n=1 Tax=Micromonospora sp. NPDC049460 TaxID=3364272 RepID=UPI003788349F